jgi:hypothetical protein
MICSQIQPDHLPFDFFFFFFVMFQQEESEVGLFGGNGQLLTLGLGLLATALAAAYVTRLAKVYHFLHNQLCLWFLS